MIAEADGTRYVTPDETLAEWPRIRGGSYRLVRITVGYKCAGSCLRYQDHESWGARIMNPEGTTGGQAFKTRAEAENCLDHWRTAEERVYSHLRCAECGELLLRTEVDRLALDIDFVEHGARGHLIRVEGPTGY